MIGSGQRLAVLCPVVAELSDHRLDQLDRTILVALAFEFNCLLDNVGDRALGLPREACT